MASTMMPTPPEWVWIVLSVPTIVSLALLAVAASLNIRDELRHRRGYRPPARQVPPPPGVNGYRGIGRRKSPRGRQSPPRR